MSAANSRANGKPESLEASKTIQRVEELFRKSKNDFQRKQFEQSSTALTKAIDYLTYWQAKRNYDIYNPKKASSSLSTSLDSNLDAELRYIRQLALNLHDSRAAVEEKTSLSSALDDGKSMINVAPLNPRGYLRVGKVLLLLKDRERALIIYKQGLRCCADQCTGETATEKMRGLYVMMKELYNEVVEDYAESKRNKVKREDTNQLNMDDIKLQPTKKRHKPVTVSAPCNMLDKLPSELVEKIILLTDMRSMIRLQCVCKSWHDYISDNGRLWSKMGLSLLESNQKSNNERKLMSPPLRARHLSHRILNTHLVKALGDPKRWGSYTRDGPLLEYVSMGNIANAEDEERCIKTLLKISRIKSIKLNLNYSGTTLINSCLTGAHNWRYHLQCLHLQGGRSIDLLLNQFYKQMPLLKEINLTILPDRAAGGHPLNAKPYVDREVPEPGMGLNQLEKLTINSYAVEIPQHSFQVNLLFPFLLQPATNSLQELCLSSRVPQSYGTWAMNRNPEIGPGGCAVFDGTHFPLLRKLTMVNIDIKAWPFVKSKGTLTHLDIRDTTLPDIPFDLSDEPGKVFFSKFSCFQKLQSLTLASVDYESRNNSLSDFFDAVLMYAEKQEMANLTSLVLTKSATLLSGPRHEHVFMSRYITNISLVTPHLVLLDISCIHGVDDNLIETVGKSWPKLRELLVHDTRVTGVGLINFFKCHMSHRDNEESVEKVKQPPLTVGIRNCDVSYDTVEWLRRQNVTLLLN